jgi:endonuclease YncB( thermonuclease family)
MSVVPSRAAIALVAALSTNPALSQAKPSPWFPAPADAIFETGDTWTAGGKRYRLYGVQSCLRGTSFTNAKGVKRDCGEASLAMLVSLVRDLRPMCYAAASVDYGRTVLVFCFATMEQGNNKGSRVDLGTALISIGYAFASVTLDSRPVYSPYLIAETQAKNTKSGLWAFPECPIRTPSFLRITSLQSPRAPPLPPHHRRATRSLNKSTASFRGRPDTFAFSPLTECADSATALSR